MLGQVRVAAVLLVVGSLLTACGTRCVTIPRTTSEPVIDLRKDIFQGVPAWEADLFKRPPVTSERTATLSERAVALSERAAAATEAATKPISAADAPGLFFLLEQVDPTSKLLASPHAAPESAPDAAGFNDRNPVPGDLADEPIYQEYVKTLTAAYSAGKIDSLPYRVEFEGAGGVPEKAKIGDAKFTMKNFRDFGEKVLKSNLQLIQHPSAAGGRLDRIDAGATKLPKWEAVAFDYFTAYYKGKFVARDGGKLSKPELGSKVSNETITNAVSVFLESVYDYAVLTSSLKGEDKAIKAPIVYETKGNKNIFLTAGGDQPTLVKLSQKLLRNAEKAAGTSPTTTPTTGATPKPAITDWKYVVERVKDSDQVVGISKQKLKIVRFISGVSGDGAGSLSDLITRTFGGIDIGFVVLGKVSVGDNDTLAKIVQTVADSLAQRGSELYVSHAIYDVTIDDQDPDLEKDSPIQYLLKVLNRQGDDEDEEEQEEGGK